MALEGPRNLANVLQLERKQTESSLTPELKEFIDRVIVPILVQGYITEIQSEKRFAEGPAVVASSQLMSNTMRRAETVR
jgi:hypothetical protein